MTKRLLLIIFTLTASLYAGADTYNKLWQKASQAQQASKLVQARNQVDKVYARALKEGNTLQWTRALYAYDALGVQMSEDSVVKNAKRVWIARKQERNAVQHALLTHMLGRLTDNDYLLALSVADTTFLKEQRVRAHLPLVKGYSLHEIFCDYLRQRDMPDSVFVGWQRPTEDDTLIHKHYDFGETTRPLDETSRRLGETTRRLGETKPGVVRVPAEGDVPFAPMKETTTSASTTTSAPVKESPRPEPKPVEGDFNIHVFNIPGGMSRTCLVEAQSGRPVKQWTLKRSDGRGQENNIVSDGNGHVWQRPTQVHDYDGIYDWTLQPLQEQGRSNALKAKDFHNGGGWNAGEKNERELRVEIQKAAADGSHYSVTLHAPHRNLTLMRDVTSGGRLVEQRQYSFSDFIHFELQWREAYGDEALVTFAYALNGHLYTAELKLVRPKK